MGEGELQRERKRERANSRGTRVAHWMLNRTGCRCREICSKIAQNSFLLKIRIWPSCSRLLRDWMQMDLQNSVDELLRYFDLSLKAHLLRNEVSAKILQGNTDNLQQFRRNKLLEGEISLLDIFSPLKNGGKSAQVTAKKLDRHQCCARESFRGKVWGIWRNR